jgi:hypothetical protein
MATKLLKYWEQWFIDHRADEIAVLVFESCRVLLRKGSMTAEDVHHIPVKNPSVRGALMKQLKRMELVTKTAIVEGSTKQSHGHAMYKWRLINPQLARELINRCERLLIPEQKPSSEKQMELL